ncbi:MAG: SAM-dependent methyltransferase [Verrucomicrobiota bacterium]
MKAIRELIKGSGPISFSRFMDLALYDAEGGFYRSGQQVTGRKGSFITSVSVGPVFGEIVSCFLIEEWEQKGRPASWRIIEQGAEQGNWISDILSSMRKRSPEAYAAVQAIIIEPFSEKVERQTETLGKAGHPEKLSWVESGQTCSSSEVFTVFISNELVDAFPFDRVLYSGGQWLEEKVSIGAEGEFIWQTQSIPEGTLWNEIKKWKLPEMEGYRSEVQTSAQEWIKEISGLSDQLVVLTFDYGHRAEEYYQPERKNGTARAYHNHQRSDDLLFQPGSQDITADVNFDLLISAGQECGLKLRTYTDQHHFLVQEAARGLLQEWEWQIRENPEDTEMAAKLRQFKTLMHPEMMGAQFKVLVQESG